MKLNDKAWLDLTCESFVDLFVENQQIHQQGKSLIDMVNSVLEEKDESKTFYVQHKQPANNHDDHQNAPLPRQAEMSQNVENVNGTVFSRLSSDAEKQYEVEIRIKEKNRLQNQKME